MCLYSTDAKTVIWLTCLESPVLFHQGDVRSLLVLNTCRSSSEVTGRRMEGHSKTPLCVRVVFAHSPAAMRTLCTSRPPPIVALVQKSCRPDVGPLPMVTLDSSTSPQRSALTPCNPHFHLTLSTPRRQEVNST